MEIPITHSQSQLTTQSWALSPTNQQPPLFLHFFLYTCSSSWGWGTLPLPVGGCPIPVNFCPNMIFLSIFFFFFFGLVAFRILVPQPGTKLAPFAVEAWSPNHWTNREFPSPNIILRFVFLGFFNCFVFFLNYYFFYFIILYWICHTSPCICHGLIWRFVICLSLSFNTSQWGQECGGLTSLLHTPKGLLCSPESWPQAPGTSHDPEYSILNDKCSIGIYAELKDTCWM